MAVAAGNRKDQELDIILLSTKDGKVIRNLTSGFNKDRGFEYIRTPGGFRNNAVPVDVVVAGRRSHRLLRPHREAEDAHPAERRHRKIEKRIELKTVDMPESPGHQPGRQGSRVLRR